MIHVRRSQISLDLQGTLKLLLVQDRSVRISAQRSTRIRHHWVCQPLPRYVRR